MSGRRQGSLEHAVGDKAVAETVHGDDEVVVVSLKEGQVELEVEVSHFKEVLKVGGNTLVLDGINFVEVGNPLKLLLGRLRLHQRAWLFSLLSFL